MLFVRDMNKTKLCPPKDGGRESKREETRFFSHPYAFFSHEYINILISYMRTLDNNSPSPHENNFMNICEVFGHYRIKD